MIDKLNQFSDTQDLGSASTGNNFSTFSIPLGGAGLDIANGRPLYVVIVIDEDFDSAADGASVSFQVVTDDNAAFSSDAVITESGAIGEAALTAGRAPLILPLPPAAAYEEFLGLNYEVSGEALTAGMVTAFLTDAPQNWKAYPDGI